MNFSNKRVLYIAKAGMIAALYVVLVLVFRPISAGSVQVRIAEALTILPFFTAAAVPGLTIGCLVANILSGLHILDIIFGTLATLIGAIGTRLLRKYKLLAPVSPIVANSLIVPWVLIKAYSIESAYLLLVLSVGIGEILSCGVLGLGLLFLLNKYSIPHLKD